MASKKNYSRYFIILQEDEKGYVFDREKNSSGYVKLEKKNNKCKVSFYAQNINPGLEPYYMILICKDRDHKKLLVLGKLNINEQGKIDMYCDYDINNIANSKMSMQHIIGATIGKVIDKDIISLMSGFVSSDSPKDWKGYEVIKITKEEDKTSQEIKDRLSKEKQEKEKLQQEQLQQEKLQQEQLQKEKLQQEQLQREKLQQEQLHEEKNQHKEKSIFEKYENSIDKNVSDKNKCNDNLRDELENQQDEINNTADLNEINCSDIELDKNLNMDLAEQLRDVEKELNDLKELNSFKDIQDDTGEDICSKSEFCTFQEDMLRKKKKSLKFQEKDDYKEELPTGKVGVYFKKLVFECEKIKDMGQEISNCVWYRIPVDSLEDLYDSSQFDRYTIIYYPMICYYSYISKYKHFCVGYKCDKTGKLQYILYAIPGSREKECQPYGGRTGFVTWIPTNNKEYGYWIMFYDFRKSSVVVPIKK